MPAIEAFPRIGWILKVGVEQKKLVALHKSILDTPDSRSVSRNPKGYYINQTASTSTMTWVRGILWAAASVSMARKSAFIFSRLGDFRMK